MLSDAEHDGLLHYIRDVADLLWLRDWGVGLDRNCINGEDDDHVEARAQVQVLRRYVRIQVRIGFMDSSPESIRQTICHELIHCHLEGGASVIDDLCGVLGQPTYALAKSAFDLHLEQATDALANVVAEHMPLPNVQAWAAGKQGKRR